jgi:hypothetical protein
MGISTFSQQTVNTGLANTIGSGNVIINGAFDIWQRGTSFTASGTAYLYSADRWNIFSSGSGRTYSRQLTGDTTNLPDIQYCIRAAKNSGDTNNSVVRLWTDLESVNSIPLAGKSVTFSFYARRGAGYSASGNGLAIQLISGTGTDQNWGHVGYTGSETVINKTATLTTAWQRFTYTATLANNVFQVGVNFAFTPVGTAGANDYFEVTGVQLEAGTVATPFRRNSPSIQAELAACQRYYQRYGFGTNALIGVAAAPSADEVGIIFPLACPMRVAPSASGSGGMFTLRAGVFINRSGANLGFTTRALQNFVDLRLGGGGFVADAVYYLYSNPLTLEFNAEI